MNIIYDSWFCKHSNKAGEGNVDLLIFINEKRRHLTKEKIVSSRIKSEVYVEGSSVY